METTSTTERLRARSYDRAVHRDARSGTGRGTRDEARRTRRRDGVAVVATLRARAPSLVLIALLCGAVAACDPAMTIRERRDGRSGAGAGGCGLELRAREAHPLIGETWYDPGLTVTNAGEVAATVDRVELVSHGVTYELAKLDAQNLERTIPAHSTKQLGVRFDLGGKAVYEVLDGPATIRVEYTAGTTKGSCALEVVGSR